MQSKCMLSGLLAGSLLVMMAVALPSYAMEGEENAVVLTLEEAVDKALKASPRLESAIASLNAAKGTAMQADVMPNPQIGIEAENILGTGTFSGIDRAEFTYGFSQEIELGGKRGYRKQAAEQAVVQEQYELTAQRLDLIRDVHVAYFNAVASEEMLALAEERKDLAKTMLNTVRKRVNSASEPKIQQRKAEIGLSTAQVAVDRLAREWEHTKHVLSSLWAGHNETLMLDGSGFFTLSTPPTEVEVESKLTQTVDFKRWEVQKKQAEALYGLEKAEAVPDPSVTVGLRDFRANSDQAFVAGVSFPLPVFDANRGNIERARNVVSKVASDQHETQIVTQNEAFEWLEGLTNAYHQARTLKGDIIPAAQQAFNLARSGYRAGRFAYLEVLDAQRMLFEAKEQYLQALTEYHTASAQLERLITPMGEES